MSYSKSLNHDDQSGFDFAKEMLNGDETAGINFDRLQYHPKYGYIIFEYLLCEESQPRVTPFTSHPKYYWYKNKRKFISLWKVTKKLEGTLFLINYAKKGTLHDDEILVIQVLNMNDDGIISEKIKHFNRKDFSDWFRKLNHDCLQK